MKSILFRFAALVIGFALGLFALAGWESLLNDTDLDLHTFSLNGLQESRFSPPAGWTQVGGCRVAFYVPPGVGEQQVHGIDSCVLQYRNENLMITLDMMGYLSSENASRRNEYSDKSEFQLKNIVVDGRKAEIITCRETNTYADIQGLDYEAVLFVPRMRRDGGNLTIWTNSRTPAERAQALKLFESVQFFR